MTVHQPAADISQARIHLDRLASPIVRGGLVAGIAGLGLSLLLTLAGMADFGRMLHSYLVAWAFYLSLALGALFFVILQHLVRAGWSVVVRRLAESLAMNMPILALLFLPILFGLREIYPWADPEIVRGDAVIAAKAGYLNPTFFVIRWVVFLGVWTWLARWYWGRSVAQDGGGDVKLSLRMERWSGPAMVAFALTLNFGAFDLLMSHDPHWYSTIFGVYYFSGGVLGFFALLSILVILLQRSGRMDVVTDEHYHDLGKLVFAFTIFWAYIAFSQYMLIWYANIPEETVWFHRRLNGPWPAVSALLLFGRFLLPFLLLLPRFVKRRPKLLGPIAGWVLLMHFVDLYWLVLPNLSPLTAPFHLLDVTCALGVGGFFMAGAAARLRARPLVPTGDPRLAESLAFENA